MLGSPWPSLVEAFCSRRCTCEYPGGCLVLTSLSSGNPTRVHVEAESLGLISFAVPERINF
jgi:hypothetical protein